MVWGWVWSDDATGSYSELAREMIDVIIGCQGVVYTRPNVGFKTEKIAVQNLCQSTCFPDCFSVPFNADIQLAVRSKQKATPHKVQLLRL